MNPRLIKSKDISVVIQGPTNFNIKRIIINIKKFLPNSEIILSTWETSDASEVEHLIDKIVYSKDPGATIYDKKRKLQNNINRMILSSQVGLKRATRKYTLRLRSDLLMINNNILKIVKTKYRYKRNKEDSLYKERIIAGDIFSLKSEEKGEKKVLTLFHVSDWINFGLTEDLNELFDVSLVNEPEFSEYFIKNKKNNYDIFYERTWNMSPEQYITSENAKKIYKNLTFKHYLDINKTNLNLSERFIINNYTIVNLYKLGFISLKENYHKTYINQKIGINNLSQLCDYTIYIENKHINPLTNLRIKLNSVKSIQRLKKHIFSLKIDIYDLKKNISNFFSDLCAIIYYIFAFMSRIIYFWKQND